MGCNCNGCSGNRGVTGLSHIGVFVRDMEKSLKFYSMLGFDCYHKAELPGEGGEIRLAFLRCGTCEIELIRKAVYEEKKDGTVDHIALSARNIDAVIERLTQNGVAFETKIPAALPTLFDNGIKNIFFRGPDGERLELVETL